MTLQAAINGKRNKQEHQRLPVTTPELVGAAGKVIAAGADTVHFHVRDADGKESFSAKDVKSQIGALKQGFPHIEFGISTGAWVEPDPQKRLALISSWNIFPDYVSVNGHEDGFEAIVRTVLAKEIKVEAGLRNLEAAKLFLRSGLLKDCFRILIEPQEQELEAALKNFVEIEALLLQASFQQRILLHGFEQTSWPILKIADSRGYQMRIGLEDTLYKDNGALAEDNAELIAETVFLTAKKSNI